MEWGGDVRIYHAYKEFEANFPNALTAGTRVLKQFRGNGGNGIFKIIPELNGNEITVIHAGNPDIPEFYKKEDFFKTFKKYFQIMVY